VKEHMTTSGQFKDRGAEEEKGKKETFISRSMRGGIRNRSAIVSAMATVLMTLMMRTSLKRRSGFTMRIILRYASVSRSLLLLNRSLLSRLC
jgi:hypothetical protein